jgi:hypothetical protein
VDCSPRDYFRTRFSEGRILLSLRSPGKDDFATERTSLAPVEIKILAAFMVAMFLLRQGGIYTYRRQTWKSACSRRVKGQIQQQGGPAPESK